MDTHKSFTLSFSNQCSSVSSKKASAVLWMLPSVPWQAPSSLLSKACRSIIEKRMLMTIYTEKIYIWNERILDCWHEYRWILGTDIWDDCSVLLPCLRPDLSLRYLCSARETAAISHSIHKRQGGKGLLEPLLWQLNAGPCSLWPPYNSDANKQLIVCSSSNKRRFMAATLRDDTKTSSHPYPSRRQAPSNHRFALLVSRLQQAVTISHHTMSSKVWPATLHGVEARDNPLRGPSIGKRYSICTYPSTCVRVLPVRCASVSKSIWVPDMSCHLLMVVDQSLCSRWFRGQRRMALSALVRVAFTRLGRV